MLTQHQIEHRAAKHSARPARRGSLAAMQAASYRGCLRLPDAKRSYIIGPGKLYDWHRSTLGQKTNTILISMRCSSAVPEQHLTSPVP